MVCHWQRDSHTFRPSAKILVTQQLFVSGFQVPLYIDINIAKNVSYSVLLQTSPNYETLQEMANKRPGGDNRNSDGRAGSGSEKATARRRGTALSRTRGNQSDRAGQPEPGASAPKSPRWPSPDQINFGAGQPPSKSGQRGTYQPLRNNPPEPTPLPTTSKSRWSRLPPNDVVEQPNQPSQPLRATPTRASRPKRRVRVGRIILYLLLTLFVVAGLTGLYVYTRLANFTSGISVQRVDINNNPINGSSFNGHDSVNIALLGLDTRPGNPDGTRSDTIIVVRVNPQTHAASMLSIPRDLWVDIPGHGQNRINSAYAVGDMARPNSGGPPLVEATLEKNFGLHIDYFAQVDFEDFEGVIDAIGGVTIDVPKPLLDAEFPTLDYGYKRIFIPAGIQHMNGQTTVEYARSRHADSDTGRNQRQQQVLTAIREQGINLNFLNNTPLQQSLQRAVKTDLQMGDILSLAQLAIGLNKDNIHNYAIDFNLAVPTDTEAGNVLMPQWDAIHTLVSQFVASTNTTQAATAPAITPALAPAKVKVLNGTFTEGRAATTQKYLQSKGFQVVGIDQATDAGNYPATLIMVYNNRKDAATALATALGIDTANIRTGDKAPSGVDIEVICGNDLKLPQT